MKALVIFVFICLVTLTYNCQPQKKHSQWKLTLQKEHVEEWTYKTPKGSSIIITLTSQDTSAIVKCIDKQYFETTINREIVAITFILRPSQTAILVTYKLGNRKTDLVLDMLEIPENIEKILAAFKSEHLSAVLIKKNSRRCYNLHTRYKMYIKKQSDFA